MKTNYYILKNNTWVKTKLNPENISYRWIKLYNDNLQQIGIGIYKPNK